MIVTVYNMLRWQVWIEEQEDWHIPLRYVWKKSISKTMNLFLPPLKSQFYYGS